MIPEAEVSPIVPTPLPSVSMPDADEISEEGFGFFRGTWFMGHIPVREALAVVSDEAAMIDWVDDHASSSEEFELLADALEAGDADALDGPLRDAASEAIEQFVPTDDFHPLGGLEIGVAGLSYALSAVGCLTAASCRWHMTDHSWSKEPVVYFATRPWRLEILGDLLAGSDCGIDSGRGMVFIYGRSIWDTHRLAVSILRERARFRRMPDRWRSPAREREIRAEQLSLYSDAANDVEIPIRTGREP